MEPIQGLITSAIILVIILSIKLILKLTKRKPIYYTYNNESRIQMKIQRIKDHREKKNPSGVMIFRD